MKFWEKLARLTEKANKTTIGKAANLPASAISNYIGKKQMPRADKAVALARELGVSTEWLVDERQGWPPPMSGVLSTLSTEEICEELGQRMKNVGLIMLSKIVRAEAVDWLDVTGKLLATPPNARLPQQLADAIDQPGQLNLLARELRHFDPHVEIGETAPAELLKQFMPAFEITLLDLWIREGNLHRRPGYKQAANLAYAWITPEELRPSWYQDVVKRVFDEARSDFKKILADAPGSGKTVAALPSAKQTKKSGGKSHLRATRKLV